jgi:hypothetical protein
MLLERRDGGQAKLKTSSERTIMNPLRPFLLLAGLLLLAVPAVAADTYQVTIDQNSSPMISTGLMLAEGDHVLVQAQGVMRLGDDRDLLDGWFGPAGLGSFQRPGQTLENSPFGGLIGTYSSTVDYEFVLGEFSEFTIPSQFDGREFLVGVNMAPEDLSQVGGGFVVHITRYVSEEATSTTVTLDQNSPRPLLTGVTVGPGDQILVMAQGVLKSGTPGHVTQGWFDASGIGNFNRVGQPVEDTAFGSLLGSFTGNLGGGFYIGDRGSWVVPSGSGRNELSLALNMSAENQASMQGELKVHILQILAEISSPVDDEGVPAAKAILALDNYPNPFNPMTTVRFELGRPQEVRVSIVNVAGDLVKTLAQRTYGAGKHHLNWDGRDQGGRSQASGTYFLRLDTDEAVQTHKLTLVR